jgi:hypothetical protein
MVSATAGLKTRGSMASATAGLKTRGSMASHVASPNLMFCASGSVSDQLTVFVCRRM